MSEDNADILSTSKVYGTFTAIQNKFVCDIFDDIEYLHDSKFFHKNKDKLFEVDNI